MIQRGQNALKCPALFVRGYINSSFGPALSCININTYFMQIQTSLVIILWPVLLLFSDQKANRKSPISFSDHSLPKLPQSRNAECMSSPFCLFSKPRVPVVMPSDLRKH